MVNSAKPGCFMNDLLRPRNWEPACGTERSAASANNMAVLPDVLGCSFDYAQDKLTLRRTSGTPRIQHPVVARWHAHLHGLATAIHKTSGLAEINSLQQACSMTKKTPVSTILAGECPLTNSNILWYSWHQDVVRTSPLI